MSMTRTDTLEGRRGGRSKSADTPKCYLTRALGFHECTMSMTRIDYGVEDEDVGGHGVYSHERT
jgi:hypothetical protein